MWDIRMGLKLDDPSAWSNGSDHRHLAISFEFTNCLADAPNEVSRYLLRHADRLGIHPGELPAACQIEESAEEARAVAKAERAIREALFLAALRWSNLEETRNPDRLRLPRAVRISRGAHGMVPLARLVTSDEGRREVWQRLRGKQLDAFMQYCRMWDRAHR